MVPEKCKRAKDEQSGRHGIRPVISKALIVLGVKTAEPIPDKRKQRYIDADVACTIKPTQ